MTLSAWIDLAETDRTVAAEALHRVRGAAESVLVRRRGWRREEAEEFIDCAIVTAIGVVVTGRRGTARSNSTLIVSFLVAVALRMRARDRRKSVPAVESAVLERIAEVRESPAAAAPGPDLCALTVRQRAAWESFCAHGSERLAARELGISRAAFAERLAGAKRRLGQGPADEAEARAGTLASAKGAHGGVPVPGSRAAIFDLYCKGATPSAIARRTHTTPGAIRQFLHRERRRAEREKSVRNRNATPATETTT